MVASNKVPELTGPGSPQLSDVVLDYGCSEWRTSSQRAADLYNSGIKLWKKQGLRDIENQLAHSTCLEVFTVCRIDGSLAYIKNPNFGITNPIWVPYVEFRDYWRLVKEQPKDPPETYHCS
ncbi:uncharacterized protein RSE6_12447 [Rhynchosporium secalis]|uniref:Uncharacterized protein n=1 Tax=Rhynchosporium secalis TaxID=38038 RepID=A0A1E1MQI3_RHYSE|nr:uncharacterized protein RSE6_12447 [Rhynchosporium secalis]